MNFLHKLTSLVHSIQNPSSWFGVERRYKVRFLTGLCTSLWMDPRVLANFGPVPRTGKLEKFIFRYFLVFEAILHLCWLFRLSLRHAQTCKFRTGHFSTADRNNCNNRAGLEELRPLSGEICKGKQLQKGLFFKLKDKQKKAASSFAARQATPVSIMCGIQYCRELGVCRNMHAWRGGRNKHVHGHVSSSKQLKSWTEASSFQAGKPATETRNAVILLPLRQAELETPLSAWGKVITDAERSYSLHTKMFTHCLYSLAKACSLRVNHFDTKSEPGISCAHA